jgi:hypothetical protein
MVHVNLFSFLKSIVSFGSRERKKEIAKIQQEDHEYARGNIESRGPCPGLNSLANQGYLYVDRILHAFCRYPNFSSLDPVMGKTSPYPA